MTTEDSKVSSKTINATTPHSNNDVRTLQLNRNMEIRIRKGNDNQGQNDTEQYRKKLKTKQIRCANSTVKQIIASIVTSKDLMVEMV